MKAIFTFLILISFSYEFCFSQGHISPCDGSASHGTGNCYGYATGRVAGRDSGDAGCNAYTFAFELSRMGDYYNYTEDASLTSLHLGDLVRFGDHAAFVVEVGYPRDSTKVDHLHSLVTLERDVSLRHVKDLGHGNWIGYWRPKIIQTSVTTYPSGGEILIDGQAQGGGSKTLAWWRAIPLEVVYRRTIGGVNYAFNYWSIPNDLRYERSISVEPKLSGTYEALYIREYVVTFQNSLPGAEAGYITINDTLRNAPHVAYIRADQNSAQAYATNQVGNRLQCTFSCWTNGSTSNPRAFTISGDSTYTATYSVVKPLSPPNVAAGGTVGQNVHVTWSEHPDTNVTQYRVWRRVKPPGGQLQDPELVATLIRGTTSWIDPTYVVTSGYTDAICNYDVRSYYSPNQTYSDPEWVGTFARYEQQKRGVQADNSPGVGLAVGESPFAVGCYPNPFNPSTTISYQLARAASVTLEIFDIMGREVRDLVDASKSAGYYTVVWNGQDASGRDVSSGVYLYRFVAAPTDGQKAFMQSGKLMLMK